MSITKSKKKVSSQFFNKKLVFKKYSSLRIFSYLRPILQVNRRAPDGIPAKPSSGAVRSPQVTQGEQKSMQHWVPPKKECVAFTAQLGTHEGDQGSEGQDRHSVYQLNNQGGSFRDSAVTRAQTRWKEISWTNARNPLQPISSIRQRKAVPSLFLEQE